MNHTRSKHIPVCSYDPLAIAPAGRSRLSRPHTSFHHGYPADLLLAIGGTLIGTRVVSDSGTESSGRIYDLAATYVVQGPHLERLSTSVEAGAGIMFVPTLPTANASHNLRSAAIVGVAAEYELTKRLGLHLGYRAQAFKTPDFNYSGNDKHIVTTTLISNEPTEGITYRFHSK